MRPLLDKARRKALTEQFQQAAPKAGVYQIVNRRAGKLLLGSSTNIPGLRNKFEFARTTNSAAALDQRLREDIAKFGFDSFSLEVLDTLEVTPETTQAEIIADLTTLEALWREKMDPSLLY